MGNPFSFKGRIGCGTLWLTLLALLPVQFLADLIPVTHHEIVSGDASGFSRSSVTYSTPAEPMTLESWCLFALFCLLYFGILWVSLAAFTKRLHDLGRSGRELLIFAGGVAVLTAAQATLAYLSAPNWIAVVIIFTLGIPFIAVSIFRLFPLLFFPAKEIAN